MKLRSVYLYIQHVRLLPFMGMECRLFDAFVAYLAAKSEACEVGLSC